MIKIRMPDFPRKVETSKARRKKYFIKGKGTVPNKYSDPARFVWVKNKLYDIQEKDYVIANPVAAGTANYAYISGNEIYARMHERVRMKVVSTVKGFMTPFIAKAIPSREEMLKQVTPPLAVRMTIRTPFGYADWDVDNLWIYHKCFLDAFKQMGYVEDDNVLFIREAGMVNFEPISPTEVPELIFSISSAEQYPSADGVLEVKEDFTEKPGLLTISPDGKTAFISVGRKKVIFGAAKDALRKLAHYCLNYNKSVWVSQELYKKYENFFKEFPKSQVKIIIHGTT
jgi:hypothetical protein